MYSILAFPDEGNQPRELPLSTYMPADRPHIAFLREHIPDAWERRAREPQARKRGTP